MGITLKTRRSKEIWIAPYADVEEFPEYMTDDGTWERLPEGWREVRFKVAYPNLQILNRISSRSAKIQVVRGVDQPLREFDPVRMVDFIVTQVIKDWENVTDEEGNPVPYDREMLRTEFLASQFLLNEFLSFYQSVAEKTEKREAEEVENF